MFKYSRLPQFENVLENQWRKLLLQLPTASIENFQVYFESFDSELGRKLSAFCQGLIANRRQGYLNGTHVPREYNLHYYSNVS